MTPVFVAIGVQLALIGSLLLVGRLASPSAEVPSRFRRTVGVHLMMFSVVYFIVLGWGVSKARANTQPAASPAEGARAGGLTVGDGLAMLGVALATAISVVGASYAVGVVGSSALGAITEKPEVFGRTLIFIGLAEGLAIYGLIVSILLLERLR